MTLSEVAGPTTFPLLAADYVVLDNTTGVSNVATLNAAFTAAGSTAVIDTPSGLNIAAGDKVTVEVFNVTNPAAQTIADFTVNTFTDSVPVTAPQYSIGAGTGTAMVTVSPATAGSTASYLIQGLQVQTGGIAAGSTITFGLTSSATSFGVFPQTASAYKITDLTNSAYSETPTTGSYSSPTITLTLSNSLPSGDTVSVSIAGVINPGAGSYTITAGTNLEAPSVAVTTTAPGAAVTYPNGAFVQSGAQVDVIAGGVGFGIPSMTDYQQIAASDSSAVVSGSFPTATTVRTGTLLKVLGSPAIYVVGTNGDAYPFSTPTEFSSDGYSAMSVVNVPSLGSLTVGSGTAPTAAVTMPDGALVQSGSTIYVYAGGVAFGIPTFADYQTIAAATGTAVVQGTVSNTTGTALTAGTLVQPIGSAGIYVSDGTSLYQFSTASQFSTDGYNGANVVQVPSITGLTVA